MLSFQINVGWKRHIKLAFHCYLWVHDQRKQELGALTLFLMTINTSKELLKSRNVYNFQILFWLDGRVPHSRVSNMAAENDTPQSMMVVVLLPPTPQQRSNTAAPPPSSDTGQHYCGGGTQPSNTLCHCSRATAQCWWVAGPHHCNCTLYWPSLSFHGYNVLRFIDRHHYMLMLCCLIVK